MATGTLFKRLKLIDEGELTRLIEKQLREYDPALKAMAHLKRDMDSAFAREDLSPEEKLSLLKASRQRFRELRPSMQPEAKAAAAALLPPIPPPVLPHGSEEPAQSHGIIAQSESPKDAYTDAFEDPPTPLATASGSSTTTTTTTSSQEGVEGPYAKLRTNERRIFPAVSEKHADRLDKLVSLLRKTPSRINHDAATGQLILEGEPVKGSSFRDVIHSLFEASKADNITGQKELLKTIGKLVMPGGEWAQENIRLRDLIPRTSLQQFLSSGSQVSLGQKGEGVKDMDGKRKRGKLHPVPPGKRIKVLYLY